MSKQLTKKTAMKIQKDAGDFDVDYDSLALLKSLEGIDSKSIKFEMITILDGDWHACFGFYKIKESYRT